MRNLTLCALITFFATNSYSQIDATFQKILESTFRSDEVSPHIFDHDYVKKGAVFIYQNIPFDNQATSFGTIEVSFPDAGLDMANIFDMGERKVFTFGSAMELEAATDGVDTLIVFQRIKVDKGCAKLSFYTTNSQSRRFQSRNSKQKFVKLQCELELKESEWVMRKVQVSDFPFKSIQDKE